MMNKKNSFLETYSNTLKALILVSWCFWSFTYSLDKTLLAPVYHLDGAFQTASGLFRLDQAQLPGRDFLPYLGIGPIFLLYPFFKIFGADLCASTLAAQWMVLCMGWLSNALLWHLMFRPVLWRSSLAAGALLFMINALVFHYFEYQWLFALIFDHTPGNSLRPFRSILPYGMGAAYYVFAAHAAPRTKCVVSGLIAGIALLWSNDYAITSTGLFTLFVMGHLLVSRQGGWPHILMYGLTMLIVWAISLTLATGGHPIALLEYNFRDVAHDQWWYYAPYDESSRIWGIRDLASLFTETTGFAFLVWVSVTVFAIQKRSIEYATIAWIGLALGLGGLVASIGGHAELYYFDPFVHWGMVTALLGLARIAYWARARQVQAPLPVGYLLALGLALFVPEVVFSVMHYSSKRANIEQSKDYFYVSELGGYLGSNWKDYVDFARSVPTGSRVIEEYWGLVSAIRRELPLWPVDSAIHALGHVRGVASEGINKADWVITTRKRMSKPWQPWNFSQNYWLYESLFKAWSPAVFSPNTIVWQRQAGSELRKGTTATCAIVSGSNLLEVTADQAGYVELDLEYKVRAPRRTLLMIRNNASFGGDASGYVSLDPAGNRAKLPAYLTRPGLNTLDIQVRGASQDHLDLVSCAARTIEGVSEEVLSVPVPIFPIKKLN